MRLLASPVWTFGRNQALLGTFREILRHRTIELHYCESDVDLNQTITAFSGDETAVADMVMRLAIAAFPSIDIGNHRGSDSSLGALNLCPFMLLDPAESKNHSELLRALIAVENLASQLAASFEMPVFLTEKSDRGRNEAEVWQMHEGGFGSLMTSTLNPDYGPNTPHPHFGLATLGVRDFLLTFKLEVPEQEEGFAEGIVSAIEELRSNGDPRMAGVSAHLHAKSSESAIEMRVSLALPDLAGADPVMEFIRQEAKRERIKISHAQVIGGIRKSDVRRAERLIVRPEQIVNT